MKKRSKSTIRNIGTTHASDFTIDGRDITVSGKLQECVQVVARKLGVAPEQIIEDAIQHLIATEKASLEFDPVETFDGVEKAEFGGVYLDKKDRVFIDCGDGRRVPATIKTALAFLADRNERHEIYCATSPNYPRFFRLLASKLPEGI